MRAKMATIMQPRYESREISHVPHHAHRCRTENAHDLDSLHAARRAVAIDKLLADGTRISVAIETLTIGIERGHAYIESRPVNVDGSARFGVTLWLNAVRVSLSQ
ncbi:MAG TPA: hypothetical protein VN812_22625 [Candidatus Acidoferrales bacterium]|nr:hypothetical protein [Candidatus Acidoferrales bacterium]